MTATINASTTAGVVTTADTSGILQLQTNGTAALTISASQVATFAQAPSLPAGSIPQAALAAGVAGNGPAFSAYKNATQSITSSTYTKVTFQTEEFDTNSNFASSTFTPTVAGYYQTQFATAPDTTTSSTQAVIYKNGTIYKRVYSTAGDTQSEVTCLVYLNGSTDYIEAYAFIIGTSPVISSSSNLTYFQAALVRSA